MTNAAGGVINLNGSSGAPITTVTGSGFNLQNLGTINKAAGSAASQSIGNANLAITNAAGGTIIVNGGALNVGGAFTQSGTLQVAGGTTLQKAGGFTNSGAVAGGGTIDVTGAALTNQGTIAAGNSPGTLTINGDLVLDGANANPGLRSVVQV